MKIKQSITFKIIALVLLSVALTGICLTVSSYICLKLGFENEAKQTLEAYRRVVDDGMDKTKAWYARMSAEQALRPRVIEAILANNHDLLKRLGRQLLANPQDEFVVFTDAQGNVLARGHDDRFGDNISNQECLRRALAGFPSTIIEAGKVVKISVRSAAPVRHEGQVIGAVITGMNITGSNKFVDEIKKTLGVQTSIFFGDVRESTTLEQDGKRMAGTPMEDKQLLGQVMNQGREAILKTNLFGRAYMAVYWPMMGMDGKAMGMLAIAKDLSALEEPVTKMLLTITVVCLVVMLLLCAAGYTVAKRTTRPIGELLAYTQQVEAGDYSHSLAQTSSDEIGALTTSVNKMVETLKFKLGFSEGVLKGLAEPVLIINPDQNLSFVNQAMLNLLGKPGKAEDYLGQNLAEFAYGDKNRETLASRCLRENQPLKGIEASLSLGRGIKRDILVYASPIHDLANQLIGAIFSIVDMTEMKHKQRVSEQLNKKILSAATVADTVSNQVAVASEQMAAQIEQSSRGAQTQAQRIESTATAMEELGATIAEVANNASDAARTSTDTRQKAEHGAAVVGNVVKAMDKVRSQAHSLRLGMGELGGHAQGIGNIMGVISEIADQTNLLALNAAIEAARAGDAGRGFAVVADEVRKLAEKTMTATQEVSKAISSIQEGAKRSMHGVDLAVRLIEDSTNMAGESGQALNEILKLADRASDQVHSIATAAEEQSQAMEEINSSIGQINLIAAQTSTSMTEANQTVTVLAGQSQKLRDLIMDMNTKTGSSTLAPSA